jgi:DNA repair exonuclease SbcCD ATPase subunit
MKRYIALTCAALLVAAAAASAIGLPTGGGKVDTKKFDELIAKIDEVTTSVEAAKVKLDTAEATISDIAEAHGIADLFSDPAKIAELKDAVTDEDKAKLQAQAEALTTLPDDLSGAVEKATTLVAEVPTALTDLGQAIADNPMAAGDLKNKKDQLENGKTALEGITSDGPALVESAGNLSNTIAGVL